MEPSPGRIAVEREDQMVSPVPGKIRREATLRPAHFLTPSGEFPIPDFPSETDCKAGPNASNLKVNFTGWNFPPKDWSYWTDRMRSLHHSVWKRAGIFDAVLSSRCKIHRCNALIYGFVEKWCPETNTFVLPWGEATLTLEDLMMIGGYSVVGSPVFSPIECPEMKEVELKLLSAISELNSTKAKKASQTLWLLKFMDSGGEIEHVAFLAMWLSRFVFPVNTRDHTINRKVLPLSILLARGFKIALAPAVLAGIYSNLSDMKNAFLYDGDLEISVYSPFQLLQIWIWERFPSLRPNPVVCSHDKDPIRFFRWDDSRFKAGVDVGLAIDESADCFVWRPYVTGRERSFLYKDEARLVSVGSEIDEDVEMLVRCLRFSELVGIDPVCIEQYLPHRVAMQFGYDQEVPGPVARAYFDQIVAWESYTRKVEDQILYIPSCLFKSGVTSRYAEWWKKNTAASSYNPKKRRNLAGNCNSSKKMRLSSPQQDNVLGKKGSSFKKSVSKRELSERNKKDDVDKAPETMEIDLDTKHGDETVIEVESSGAVDAEIESGESANSVVHLASAPSGVEPLCQSPAGNKSSHGVYSIEEVKAMVEDLAYTWARVKPRCASAATKMIKALNE